MELYACADESSEKYRTLYEQQTLFDVILIAGIDGVRLSAHRIVLTKWSGYFKGVFRSQLKEAQTGEIKLKEFDGRTLKLVLDFMYTVPIELCSETAVNVFKAADYFQISTLANYCCDIIPDYLQTSNCLSMHLFSEQHNLSILKKKTYEFVYSNFDDVCNEKEYLQLNERELNKFILDDRRIFRSEEKLYTSLVKWVEHDKPNRENSLLNLLKHIDFRRLEPEFIIEHSIPRHLPSESRIRQTNELAGGSEWGLFEIQTFHPDLDIWFAENWPPPYITSIYLLAVVNKNLVVSDGVEFECLDLETMKWTKLPQVSEDLEATAVIESEGDLYVLKNDGYRPYSSFIHKYDFSTRRWMDIYVRHSGNIFGKLAVHDGLFYIKEYSNRSLECCDPTAENWTSIPMEESEGFIYDMVGMGEYLYVVLNQNNPRIVRYHPSTNSWTEIWSMGYNLEDEYMPIRCVVFNKRLLVYGSNRHLGFLKEYNPETNQLTSLPWFKEKDVILFTIKN